MEISHFFTQMLVNLDAMPWLELCAVILSLVYVTLAAKRNVWCWPAGLIASGIYVYLCLITNLYVESILQSYYVFMAIYGWFAWQQQNNQQATLPVSQLSAGTHIKIILLGALTAFAIGYIFTNFTNAAMPYLDALTTVFSFIATWMVTRKILENWLYWVVIDIASIFLYTSREYTLTGGLYGLYTIIAIIGFFAWKKQLQTQQSSPSLVQSLAVKQA